MTSWCQKDAESFGYCLKGYVGKLSKHHQGNKTGPKGGCLATRTLHPQAQDCVFLTSFSFMAALDDFINKIASTYKYPLFHWNGGYAYVTFLSDVKYYLIYSLEVHKQKSFTETHHFSGSRLLCLSVSRTNIHICSHAFAYAKQIRCTQFIDVVPLSPLHIQLLGLISVTISVLVFLFESRYCIFVREGESQ
jgi:hypothetical protein